MNNRFNQYKIMWIFIHFDLPTETKKDRKEYAKFRKFLLEDGFTMFQYSMYARHCSSRENAMVHKNRVKREMPPQGEVIIFEITDVQFSRMEFFHCKKKQTNPNAPTQLSLF
jgi:CRISPR-associated protein Cas2